MHEKIILAPSANGTELLRTLARYGVNTLGLRIMGSTELAEHTLMHSGETITETYLNSSGQAALIYSLLVEIPYFSAVSYADAQNIANTLTTLRHLVPENEAEVIHEIMKQGEFPENSTALAAIYDKYILTLKNNKYIDNIQIIRRAITDSAPLSAELITLKEYPLTPLEQHLADSISSGNIHETELCELVNVKPIVKKISSITKADGAENEVESIISAIFKNELPVDKCLIALAEPARYSQLIYELADQYGIPVSFGCGLPITNSNPAQVLCNLSKWMTTGFFGVDSLTELVNSPAFDDKKLRELLEIKSGEEFKEILLISGNLRLCTDEAVNNERLSTYEIAYPEKAETAATLWKLAAEFQHGISYMVAEYSRIREGAAGKLDCSALDTICRELDSFSAFADNSISEIIPDILSRNVCAENSKGGCLHVCTISQVLSCMRENLFIAGLSAGNFPGSPAENYLVPDNDMLLFGENVPTSENIVIANKTRLLDVMKIASALDSDIKLSYSGFDTSELKEENASSVLFELFCEYCGGSDMKCFEKSLIHTGYFDNNIGILRHIGKAYNSGADISFNAERIETPVNIGSDIVLSPTDVEIYVQCPRKFYLAHILKIQIPDTDDIFTVISPLDLGNLVHKLLEIDAKEHFSPKELYKLAEDSFDRFIAGRPPVNEHRCKEIRSQFLEMVLNGQAMSAKNNIIEPEMKIEPVEIGGIMLRGKLDRLEQLPSGEYIIADFKTGSRITHKEDDIESCLQVLLYAAMLKKAKNITVSRGEYRYLRYRKSIICNFTESVEYALDEILGELATSLETGVFKTSNNCTYCEYKNICRKEERENG